MAGEHDWLVAAAREYERPLLAYVRRLLRGDERSRDIVQDAFVQLCQQSPADLDGRLAPWLFTVCRRRVIDVLRKENRMSALSDTLDPPTTTHDPAAQAETHDTANAILAKLGSLPPSQQEAVRLKFLQQFSYREIADVMGLSESHVGVLLHQAIKTLRASFLNAEFGIRNSE
jgi:RNA polymerase sigma factor (sigma-70 family)